MLTHLKNALIGFVVRGFFRKSLAPLWMAVAFGTSLQAIDPTCAARVDWTTLPSTFTHDVSGNRVDQYAEGIQPTTNEASDRQRSGYRHTRSTLQAGSSVDNFHIVDRWGGPVQPYGEWRYPYRPYSVPYGAWGPQNPQVSVQQSGAWGYGYSGFPQGYVGPGSFSTQGFQGNGFSVGPNNALRPEQDDYYPAAPEQQPASDRDFFFVPRGR